MAEGEVVVKHLIEVHAYGHPEDVPGEITRRLMRNLDMIFGRDRYKVTVVPDEDANR